MVKAYLFEVKKPEESKGPWDYHKTIATISPEDAAAAFAGEPVPAREGKAIAA